MAARSSGVTSSSESMLSTQRLRHRSGRLLLGGPETQPFGLVQSRAVPGADLGGVVAAALVQHDDLVGKGQRGQAAVQVAPRRCRVMMAAEIFTPRPPFRARE